MSDEQINDEPIYSVLSGKGCTSPCVQRWTTSGFSSAQQCVQITSAPLSFCEQCINPQNGGMPC